MIWRQESEAVAQTPQPSREATTRLHIDRADGDGADPQTMEYSLSFGGSKDRVATVLIATRKGLDALRTFLASLAIASADIESACHVLTEHSHREWLASTCWTG